MFTKQKYSALPKVMNGDVTMKIGLNNDQEGLTRPEIMKIIINSFGALESAS